MEEFATNTGVCVAGVPIVKMDFVQSAKNTAVHSKVPRIISRHQHLNTGSCHHILYRDWDDFATTTGVCVAGVPNVKMDFVQTVKNTAVH